MKDALRILLLSSVMIFTAYADTADNGKGQTHLNEPTTTEVLTALSKRSGLTEADLKNMLADCDANQTSMNFCAYRDFVAAELVLKRVVDAKRQRLPDCHATIDSMVKRWEVRRDRSCEKSADKEYGGGSMKPMALAMCLESETVEMTRRIDALNSCRQR